MVPRVDGDGEEWEQAQCIRHGDAAKGVGRVTRVYQEKAEHGHPRTTVPSRRTPGSTTAHSATTITPANNIPRCASKVAAGPVGDTSYNRVTREGHTATAAGARCSAASAPHASRIQISTTSSRSPGDSRSSRAGLSRCDCRAASVIDVGDSPHGPKGPVWPPLAAPSKYLPTHRGSLRCSAPVLP